MSKAQAISHAINLEPTEHSNHTEAHVEEESNFHVATYVVITAASMLVSHNLPGVI